MVIQPSPHQRHDLGVDLFNRLPQEQQSALPTPGQRILLECVTRVRLLDARELQVPLTDDYYAVRDAVACIVPPDRTPAQFVALESAPCNRRRCDRDRADLSA